MKLVYSIIFYVLTTLLTRAQIADTIWTRDLSSVEAYSVCFSPNGEKIAVAYSCHGPLMRIFETSTGNMLWQSTTPDLCLYNVKFSSNGRYVAIAEEVGHLTVFDLDSLEILYNVDTESGGLYEVDFNSDGTKIVTACIDGSIRVYEALTGNHIHTIPNAHTGAVLCLDISDDDQYIVSGGEDSKVKMWKMNSWSFEREFTGHTGDVRCVKFTPSGFRILSGATDDEVKIWNSNSGTLIHNYQEHWADLNDIDVSKDETFAVTGANDMTIKVIDLFDYHTIQSLANIQQTRVYGVSISPDQTKVAAGVQNGAVILWNIQPIVNIEEELTLSTTIYPNPADEFCIIETEESIQSVSIFDLNGKKIFELFQPGKIIPLENLPAGIYTMMILSENNGKESHSLLKLVKK